MSTAGRHEMHGPVHHCMGGGALVGLVGFIPDSRLDYAWSLELHGLGCSHVVCDACDGVVESRPPTGDGGRAYRCTCTDFVAFATFRLAGTGSSPENHRPPAAWHCGGHPVRRLPLALDGVAIGARPDWRELVVDTVAGRLKPQWPDWLPAYPHAWLERLVATVDDAERQRFADFALSLRHMPETAWTHLARDIAAGLGLDSAAPADTADTTEMADAGLEARWILIDAPPGTGRDACTARVGFESTIGVTKVLGDVQVGPCPDLDTVLANAQALIARLGLPLAPVFSLVYPRYPASGALEVEMHRIAWAIKDAADVRGWEFARDIPPATHHATDPRPD